MTAPESLITLAGLVAIYAAVALRLGRTGFERRGDNLLIRKNK